jgi:hypothetical protein
MLSAEPGRPLPADRLRCRRRRTVLSRWVLALLTLWASASEAAAPPPAAPPNAREGEFVWAHIETDQERASRTIEETVAELPEWQEMRCRMALDRRVADRAFALPGQADLDDAIARADLLQARRALRVMLDATASSSGACFRVRSSPPARTSGATTSVRRPTTSGRTWRTSTCAPCASRRFTGGRAIGSCGCGASTRPSWCVSIVERASSSAKSRSVFIRSNAVLMSDALRRADETARSVRDAISKGAKEAKQVEITHYSLGQKSDKVWRSDDTQDAKPEAVLRIRARVPPDPPLWRRWSISPFATALCWTPLPAASSHRTGRAR